MKTFNTLSLTAALVTSLMLGVSTADADHHKKSENTLSDATIVELILTGSNTEVELAKFAMQQTQHQEVQQFAGEIREDHADLEKKLRALDVAGKESENPFVKFQDQVSKAMLKTVREELGQKSSDEFNKAFLAMALHAHTASIQMMQVAHDHHAESGELKEALADAIDLQKDHVKQAKQLYEKIAKQ